MSRSWRSRLRALADILGVLAALALLLVCAAQNLRADPPSHPSVASVDAAADFVLWPGEEGAFLTLPVSVPRGAPASVMVWYHNGALMWNQSPSQEAGAHHELYLDGALVDHASNYVTLPPGVSAQSSVDLAKKVAVSPGEHVLEVRVRASEAVAVGGYYGSEPGQFSASLSAMPCH